MKYRLVALVTHMGSSPNCGHYTAVAEASNGQFYQFDDSIVRMMSAQAAVNTDAYIIIYERVDRNAPNPNFSQCSTASFNSNNSSNGSCSNSVRHMFSPRPSTVINSNGSSGFNSSQSRLLTSPSTSSTSSKFNIPFLKSNGSALCKAINGANGSESKLVNSSLGIKTPAASNDMFSSKVVSNGTKNSSDPARKINIYKPEASLTNSSKLFPTIGSGFSKPGISNNAASKSIISNGLSNGKSNSSEKPIRLVPYDPDDKDNSSNDSDHDSKVSNGRVRKSSPKESCPLPVKKLKSSSPERSHSHQHHHHDHDKRHKSRSSSSVSSSSLSDDNDEHPLIKKDRDPSSKDKKKDKSSKLNGVMKLFDHAKEKIKHSLDSERNGQGPSEREKGFKENGNTNGNGKVSMNGSGSSTRSLSEERDQCLRKNRNPSPVRSGSRSPLSKEKDSKFDVQKIYDRERKSMYCFYTLCKHKHLASD